MVDLYSHVYIHGSTNMHLPLEHATQACTHTHTHESNDRQEFHHALVGIYKSCGCPASHKFIPDRQQATKPSSQLSKYHLS